MKGNWTQFLKQLINEELDEMAKSGRVSKNIIIVDKDKIIFAELQGIYSLNLIVYVVPQSFLMTTFLLN